MSDANTNEGGYPVSVDYNRPLEGVISEGYNTLPSDSDEHRGTSFSVFVLTFEGTFTVQDMLKCIDAAGMRPLSLEEAGALKNSPEKIEWPKNGRFLAVRK